MSERRGPLVVDLDDPGTPVADAPPPDAEDTAPPTGAAMAGAAAIAARRPSRLVRWFWRLLLTILLAAVSVAAWRFAADLVAANPLLGWAVTALLGAFVAVSLALAMREAAAFARLGRIDALRHQATAARADADLAAARRAVSGLVRLQASRPETREARRDLAAREDDILDATGWLDHAERQLLGPLDAAARTEVEAAARQVAAVTALVPLALADVAGALVANLRMIRRIAEIYGGRSGTLGAWRLTRAVMAHLVATGAVAVGDDMLEPILGGGLLARVSRRFGEGLVNGALTARVGVAAIEVCRPLPFSALPAPSVRGIVRRALTGLFSTEKG